MVVMIIMCHEVAAWSNACNCFLFYKAIILANMNCKFYENINCKMRDLRMIAYKLRYVMLPKAREEGGKELRDCTKNSITATTNNEL